MHLRELQKNGKKSLVVYLTAGFPDEATFLAVAQACIDAGVDVLEIGVPFSDPTADGPVIQLASQAALDGGVSSLKRVAELTAKVHALAPDLPLVWMGYLNPYLRLGLEHAIKLAAEAGVQGWIIPDLPLEEAAPFVDALAATGGDSKPVWIPLLASTTRMERAKAMLELAGSFAYYVSVKGVTGARDSYPAGWEKPLQAIRSESSRPLYVGFGVSGPALAQECVREADGVIIGSKVLSLVMDNKGHEAEAVGSFLREIRGAIDQVG